MRFGNIMLSLLLALSIPALAACGGDESSPVTAALATETLALALTSPATGTSTEPVATTSSTSESVEPVTEEILLTSNNIWTVPLMQMNGGVAVRIKGTVENGTVGPVRIEGAKHAVYSEAGSVIRDLNIADFEAFELHREGIRLRGDVNRVTIRNFNIRMRAQKQVSPDLPIGITILEGSNISISDGYIGGFQMEWVKGTYTNGDGIASERPVDSLLIERVTANDNSDAGFDLKSSNTVLNDTYAQGNKRNYRFWATVRTGTITSGTPLVTNDAAHVWVGKGAEVVIDRLVASSTSTAPVLWIEPDAKSVTVKACELNVPAGTKFFIGGKYTVTSFGAGCAL
jgi:hypothetical protein